MNALGGSFRDFLKAAPRHEKSGTLVTVPTSIFLALVLLRFFTAFHRVDLHWPDEHFQTLEPAFGAVHGFWYKAWEWKDGFRSWIPPLLFVPMFFLLKLVGIQAGLPLIFAGRLFAAGISLLIPYGLDRMARQLGWSVLARTFMLIAFLAHPTMALWGPAPLTDSLSTGILWGLFPIAWDRLQKSRGLAAGFLVSLPFLIRPQIGIYALTFGAMVLLLPRYRAQVWKVLAGGLIAGAIYGLVDWIAWGAPFYSLYMQFTKGMELSEFYGTDVWTGGFSRLIEDQGALWLSFSILLGAAGVLYRRPSKVVPDSPSAWIAMGSLVFFGVHCLIPHKETRFLEPVFPVFFLCLGYGVEAFRGAISRFPWEPWVPALTLAALTSGFVASVSETLYLSSVDTTPIFERIRQEERAHPERAGGCILMVNYSWSWSRGALGLGREYPGEDRKLEDVTGADLSRCRWIVVRDNRVAELEQKGESVDRHLITVYKQPNGFVLMR